MDIFDSSRILEIVGMRDRKLFLTTILPICLALSGCYEMDAPLIEKGERGDIAYRYKCTMKMDGKTKPIQIREENIGSWYSSNYKYRMDGDTVVLKQLEKNRYVAQIGDRPPFKIALATIEKDYITIGVANVMNKNLEIERISPKNGIELKPINAERIRLEGKNDKIVEFLKEHTGDLVYSVMGCARIGD